MLLLNSSVTEWIPSASTVKSLITSKYLSRRGQLKDEFASVQQVSMTADLWRSPNCLSILGVATHWTDGEFNLQACLLAARETRGSHSRVNVALFLNEGIEEYGLKKKVYCITADNASSNKTMVDSMDPKPVILGGCRTYLEFGCKGRIEAIPKE